MAGADESRCQAPLRICNSARAEVCCPRRQARRADTIVPMAVETATLQEQLAEIGVQLDWVRDYL
jgi:hypothetical protein